MNYRHLFHAGNFADVFKHAALILLLRALHKKDTPFCYVDTHAGIGRYDLSAPDAQRNPEYRAGIGRLWEASPPLGTLADYLDIVRSFNADGRLRFYPGSPRVARRLLRAQDRMVLCEQHPDEVVQLRQEFRGDRQTAVHERDGYEALKALLPPVERRGLVLIDPPYEQPDEFEQIMKGLATAYRRWATGIYAIWYPIKERIVVERFLAQLRAGEWRKILVAELVVVPEDTTFRLNGCGLAVINPPWEFDREFAELLPNLGQRLSSDGVARTTLEWLNPE